MRRLQLMGVVALLVLAFAALLWWLIPQTEPLERFTFSFKFATVVTVDEDGEAVQKLEMLMGNANHECVRIDDEGRPLNFAGWWIDEDGNAHSPFGNVIPNQTPAPNRMALSRAAVAAMLATNEPRMLDCPDGQVTVVLDDSDLGRVNHQDTEMRTNGTIDTPNFNFTLAGSASRASTPTASPNTIDLSGSGERAAQSNAISCNAIEATFGENRQGLKFEHNGTSDFCEVVIEQFSLSDDQAQGRFYFIASKNNQDNDDRVLVVIDGQYLVDVN